MATPAAAQTQQFNVPAGSLRTALDTFARQSGRQVVYRGDEVASAKSPGVRGARTAEQALDAIVAGSGFVVTKDRSGAFAVAKAGNGEAVVSESPPGGVETASQRGSGNEIVVTGSHIRGGDPVGSKVFSFDRNTIEQQGYSTVPEFIKSLPQNVNTGFAEDGADGLGGVVSRNNFTKATGINLRGLGNASTLTLLNGRRLAPTGVAGDSVDISMIPLAAIERVEVMADGASAIYGSDAVGGVVNFILRKDYDGAETRVRYGGATQGGLEDITVGQTFGKAWSGGYGLIAGEYSDREGLLASQRRFSRTAQSPTALTPDVERYSIFAAVGQDVTPNLGLNATAFYSKRNTFNFYTNLPAVPKQESRTDTRQYGATIGADLDMGGMLKGWRASAVGAYNRNESISDSVSVATNSHLVVGRTSDVWSGDLTFDGPLFAIAGDEAKLALGGHWRQESLGNRTRPVPLGGSTFVLPHDFSREVWAAFGELRLPLVGPVDAVPGIHRLEFSSALRYEHYSDFGSTTNPKFGVLWSPLAGANLRATYGTSFRAPLFSETDEGGNVAFLFGGIPNAAGAPKNVLLLAGAGNRDIGPEKARTWTAGLDINPVGVPRLRSSLTYFNIDYKGRIQMPAFGVGTMLTDPRFADLVDIGAPSPAVLALIQNYQQLNFTFPQVSFANADAVFDGRLANLARNKTTGLDFSLSYGMDTGSIGDLSFNVNGTYILDYKVQVTGGSPEFEAVNTIRNPIDLRVNGGVTWSYEGLTTNFMANYVAGYKNNVVAPMGDVKDWTTFNLTLSYNTADRVKGLLGNTIFTLSAVNLFDRDPPFVTSQRTNSGINYDPGAASAAGRVVSFQITKRW